jgi:hypothetical protein
MEVANCPDAVLVPAMPTPLKFAGSMPYLISRPALDPVKLASQTFGLRCTVQCDHARLTQIRRQETCERLNMNVPGKKLPFSSSRMSESRELFLVTPGKSERAHEKLHKPTEPAITIYARDTAREHATPTDAAVSISFSAI